MNIVRGQVSDFVSMFEQKCVDHDHDIFVNFSDLIEHEQMATFSWEKVTV